MITTTILGEVAEYINGVAFKPTDWTGKGRRIVRIQNLTDKAKPYNHTERVVEKKYEINKGDILVSWSASLGVFIWEDEEQALLNQHIFKVVPNENVVDKKYLSHALNKALDDMERHLHGATMKHINRGEFLSTPIYLPPLEEQKRIAAILDKADAIRRKRQQAIDLTDQLLRSVFLELFGDPVTNPKGWKIYKLREIAHIQIGPFGTQLHKEDYVENGIPIVNPTHIINGKIVPTRKLSITKEKHKGLTEYHLSVGDIVMGRRGEMGRCALVTESEKGWLCGTGSLYIRPKKLGIFSEYLYSLLSGSALKSYLESESLGATMPNLNKGIVENIDVPIPTDFVLNRYSKICYKYEFLAYRNKVFSDISLFDSLSQRAFRGELSQVA